MNNYIIAFISPDYPDLVMRFVSARNKVLAVCKALTITNKWARRTTLEDLHSYGDALGIVFNIKKLAKEVNIDGKES